jgi:hypothetical protein
VLYARHLLLAEIGEAGQQRLLESRVKVADEPSSGPCSDALRRAGVTVTRDEANRVVHVGSEAEVARLAGRSELIEAARALRAAFVAVETIKSIARIGTEAAFPTQLTLASFHSRADQPASTEDV